MVSSNLDNCHSLQKTIWNFSLRTVNGPRYMLLKLHGYSLVSRERVRKEEENLILTSDGGERLDVAVRDIGWVFLCARNDLSGLQVKSPYLFLPFCSF